MPASRCSGVPGRKRFSLRIEVRDRKFRPGTVEGLFAAKGDAVLIRGSSDQRLS